MSVIRQCQLICLLQSRSKKRGPSWPPNLRLVCIHTNSLSHNLHDPVWDWECTLMDLLAKSIPTIRVVKIVGFHRTVRNFWPTDRADIPENESVRYWPIQPQHVRSTRWDLREGTVMRNEMLERLDCEETRFEEG